MELLSDPHAWIAFFTLTALELVLGIDNIIFISILVDKLPGASRDLARRIGLTLAMFIRIGLLFLLAWISGLIEPLFTVLRQEISGRDLILFAGGIGRFVSTHPTVKMLALAFLFVIGVVLIADGFDHHVPKGYVYFAMAFSVCVEMLNLRVRKRAARPVELRDRYTREGG